MTDTGRGRHPVQNHSRHHCSRRCGGLCGYPANAPRLRTIRTIYHRAMQGRRQRCGLGKLCSQQPDFGGLYGNHQSGKYRRTANPPRSCRRYALRRYQQRNTAKSNRGDRRAVRFAVLNGKCRHTCIDCYWRSGGITSSFSLVSK